MNKLFITFAALTTLTATTALANEWNCKIEKNHNASWSPISHESPFDSEEVLKTNITESPANTGLVTISQNNSLATVKNFKENGELRASRDFQPSKPFFNRWITYTRDDGKKTQLLYKASNSSQWRILTRQKKINPLLILDSLQFLTCHQTKQ